MVILLFSTITYLSLLYGTSNILVTAKETKVQTYGFNQ